MHDWLCFSVRSQVSVSVLTRSRSLSRARLRRLQRGNVFHLHTQFKKFPLDKSPEPLSSTCLSKLAGLELLFNICVSQLG